MEDKNQTIIRSSVDLTKFNSGDGERIRELLEENEKLRRENQALISALKKECKEE